MNAHRINKGEGIDMRGGKDADFFFATKESNQEVVDTTRPVLQDEPADDIIM